MRVGLTCSRNSAEARVLGLKGEKVEGSGKLKFFTFGRKELEVMKVGQKTAFLC